MDAQIKYHNTFLNDKGPMIYYTINLCAERDEIGN